MEDYLKRYKDRSNIVNCEILDLFIKQQNIIIKFDFIMQPYTKSQRPINHFLLMLTF
jgi:hypothetical protein